MSYEKKQVSAWGFSENLPVLPAEQSSTPPAQLGMDSLPTSGSTAGVPICPRVCDCACHARGQIKACFYCANQHIFEGAVSPQPDRTPEGWLRQNGAKYICNHAPTDPDCGSSPLHAKQMLDDYSAFIATPHATPEQDLDLAFAGMATDKTYQRECAKLHPQPSLTGAAEVARQFLWELGPTIQRQVEKWFKSDGTCVEFESLTELSEKRLAGVLDAYAEHKSAPMRDKVEFLELELNNFRRNAAHRAEQLAEEKVSALRSEKEQLEGIVKEVAAFEWQIKHSRRATQEDRGAPIIMECDETCSGCKFQALILAARKPNENV